MNILREYTLDYIKRNKKSSITIMLAMLIATILMNSLGLFAYNIWDRQVNEMIKIRGNWHGELYGGTLGKDLNYVKSYASVDEVMVKGQWYTLKIEDARRPYLVLRDANEAYWNSMTEQYLIIEGHMPEKKGELAISKQFMEAHPEYRVGDEMTLPIGERMKDNISLDPRSSYKEKEKFKIEKEVTYTIVGILDMTTASIVPAYTGIGYLEEKDILPEDELTVYIRFKNMRDTYKELPKIAEGIGYEKDEYGDYLLRYNSSLLSKYLVLPKHEGKYSLLQFVTPIMGIAIVATLIGVFVFIIHNAFEISMNHRKKQLGMFKSIGATPKQIKASIIFEALILSIIPIILGLMISMGLSYWFIERMNELNAKFENEMYTYKINFWVEVMVVAAVLIIAWLSAYVPSRKISKKMPIEILKGELTSKLLKKKKKRVKRLAKIRRASKTEDIYRELANSQFKANKKSFRTSIISLTLSFMLFMVFITAMRNGKLINDIYYSTESKSNIILHIQDGNPVDPLIHQAIEENSKIKEAVEITDSQGTIWVSSKDESEEFKKLGGLEAILNDKYYIYERNNQYRIRTNLIALDDQTFKAYCQQIGADWQDYYSDEGQKVIIYNKTIDTFHSTQRNVVYIDFLNLKQGNQLRVNEKVYEEDLGDSEVDVEVGYVTDQLPEGNIWPGNYTLTQIMPLSTYQRIIASWELEKALRAMRTSIYMQVDEGDIESVSNWVEEECEKIYGSGDYHIWDEVEERKIDEAVEAESMKVIIFITLLFAVIGISNAFFTVYTSLEQRSRTFAMLRSIGISTKGIIKLLGLEALHFAIKPIIYASIIEIGWMSLLIKIDDSNWGEFIAYMPIGTFCVFALLIILAIMLAYFIGSYQIRKQNIVEVIKDDTL